MIQEKYLLDTSAIIQAYKEYYQVEIVPSFWQFLKQDKSIFTLEKVKKDESYPQLSSMENELRYCKEF